MLTRLFGVHPECHRAANSAGSAEGTLAESRLLVDEAKHLILMTRAVMDGKTASSMYGLRPFPFGFGQFKEHDRANERGSK